jgi:hypothetical protein
MSEEGTRAEIYDVKGPGIELTYRRSDGKVDINSEDDSLLRQEDLDVVETVEPEVGLHLTATLLPSTRAGTRIMLTVLLPEVRWPPGTEGDSEAITGVATVSESFERFGGHHPPPVRQSYGDPRRLEGTASRAG